MLSILLGAVVMFIFGALWYTVLFGKIWAGLMGFNTDGNMDMKSMVSPLLLNFVVNVISAGVVYYLFPQLLSVSFGEFIKVIAIIWFGFSFPIYVNQTLWEKKSWKLIVLNTASGLISFGLLSAVIYFMQ